MNKIYTIADTHFHHRSVIRFDNRPFHDLFYMNEALIDNWNSVVDKGDQVFVVGDFCFGNRKDTEEILKRLNGMKFLVIGNHDSKSIINAKGWQWTGHYYKLNYNDRKFVFCHYPILSFENVHKGACHIHGHVHGNLVGEKEGEWGKMIDVGCMNIGYTPISLDDLIIEFDKLPMKCFDNSHTPNK